MIHASLHIPRLAAGIPTSLVPISGRQQAAKLTHCLLDAGVIHGEVSARRAREPLPTCKAFLEAWVREQIAELKCLALGFRLLMGGEQRTFAAPTQAEPEEATILWFTECSQFAVGAALDRLEEIRPGLGATVLTVVDQLSMRLIPAFTPWDTMGMAQEHYWYGESDETMALDENCGDDPGERATMQQEMVTRAKIDAAFPSWATTWPRSRKRISRRELKRVATSARASRVRAVAEAALALDRLDLDEAFRPEAEGWFVGYGPVLSWKRNDITVRVFDDYGNDAVQGDYFDWIGEFSFDIEDAQAVGEWMAAMKVRLEGIRLLDTLIHELSTGDWCRVPKGFR